MAKFKYLLANVCLALLILIGGMLTLFGLVHAPFRPSLLLDVVLTREELADERKKEETLAMLRKIPHKSGPTILAGVVITTLSAIAGWAIAVPGKQTDRQD